ncbi:AfsR/SARP family transcriptional regulator [Kribbella sp. CA-253562]|uniref:AfsR/SARP family transcriptional regulator n=1 Tax=Kribbella sp. CA-253562 TaxID=3239942 RepID=UPI003D8B4D6A
MSASVEPVSGEPVFGVLGPVVAWDNEGEPLPLKGPRHRAVLARLIVARGRVVPVGVLVDDLWTAPPAGAVSAVRTFVAALRRALEPEREARAKPRVLITDGPGYALRLAPDAVDAWRFERAVATSSGVEEALGWWRGPAYADFPDEPWARAERSRLTELRLQAVELLAADRVDSGRAAAAVPDLDAHVSEHPWREEGWRLLALALYRSGRQGDALAVLRRARSLLVGQLGVDPGPDLRQLETDILRQADRLSAPDTGDARLVAPAAPPGSPEATVWDRAVAAYEQGVGPKARLESTVGLLRSLAITGGSGLVASREHRLTAISAAEELGDPELTARVIGAYDVPAIWTRSDDEQQAAAVVAAAERTLAATGGLAAPVQARLLATIAMESRGSGSSRARAAALRAVEIARGLDDPGVLAFALNGLFLQTFHRTGLAPERDAIGAELIDLAGRHGLVTYEVLGHLIRIQALSALGDFESADAHAAAADRLAAKHETPLVAVFTRWYGVLRDPGEAAYREVAKLLDGAGMPGVQRGLLPLAVLTVRLREGRPLDPDADYGPYEPWVRLLFDGEGLDAVPDPPQDLLQELLWVLVAEASLAFSNKSAMDRAARALEPARAELAAGSGLVTLGSVADVLDRLRTRRTGH